MFGSGCSHFPIWNIEGVFICVKNMIMCMFVCACMHERSVCRAVCLNALSVSVCVDVCVCVCACMPV